MTEQLIAVLIAQGYKVFTRPSELNIVGVRGKDMTPNRFNDRIHVFYKDNNNSWQSHSFAATTDPGTFWLENPANPQGTAILNEGQYVDTYAIGLHRSKYLALVQRKPVTVIRDSGRNATVDLNGKEDTGLFGINIHRALQQGTTRLIDKHSAGCQVLANADDFKQFMALCEQHKELYGNVFTYTLLNEALAVRIA